MVVIGGIAAIILVLVVLVTMLVRGRGRAPEEDSVESFGGVEQMDPVEAYVQQLLAQGYDEQTARQYAQQYYAPYSAQQGGDGG